MRVRTAHAEFHKARAVQPFFGFAAALRVAWVTGTGRIYADLEKHANAAGYRVWTHENEGEGLWVAVREDLIAEDGWDAGAEHLNFTSTNEGLGVVNLVGSDLFDERDDVSLEPTSVMRTDATDHTRSVKVYRVKS